MSPPFLNEIYFSFLFSISPSFTLISRMLGRWGLISHFQEQFVKVRNRGFLESLGEFACKIDEDGYSICGKILKYSFNLINAGKTVQVFSFKYRSSPVSKSRPW